MISIIIPAYNASKYVDRCITSILNQTEKNYEIIVINDGSIDDTLEKLKKYENQIKIIDKKNSGVSESRNMGLDCAKGEYVLFIDIDDYIDKDYIKELNKIISLNYDIIETPLLFELTKKNKIINYTEYKLNKIECNNFNNEFIDHELRYVIGVLYKKSVIDNIRFDNNIKCYEDSEFNLRVKKNCKKYFRTDNPLYHYVQNFDSLSKKPSIKQMDYIKVINNISKIYDCKEIEKVFYDNLISIILFKLPYIKGKFKLKNELLFYIKKYSKSFYKKHFIGYLLMRCDLTICLYFIIIRLFNMNKIACFFQSNLNKIKTT